MKNPSNYIYSLGEDFYDFLMEKQEIIPTIISEIKVTNENKNNIKELDADLSGNVDASSKL